MLETLIARRFTKSLRRDGFSRFTTLVSISSVALGCIALIISISVLNGYEEKIKETASRYTSHIEVRSLDPNGLKGAEAMATYIRTLDGVNNVEGIVVREALARTKSGVDGVLLHGMTTERLEQLGGRGTSIGVDLARRLSIEPGDTLVVYASQGQPGMNNETMPILFALPIKGLIKTGMQSVDESIIAMPREDLVQYLRMDDRPTMLSVTLDDPDQAYDVAREILRSVPASVTTITWQDRYATVASWIELQKQPIPIVLGLISIVTVFTLISTLLVAVVEKTRSIAILLSIGLHPRRIMVVVALRALWIAIIGSLIGVAVSATFAFVQNTYQIIRLDGEIYYVSVLPVSADPAPYLIVPAISIALALIAALIPMIAARRVQPARALRFA